MDRKGPLRYKMLLRVRKMQEGLRAQEFAQALCRTRDLEKQKRDLDDYQPQVLERAGTEATARFVARRVRSLYQFERHLGRLADRKDVEVANQRKVADARWTELEDTIKKRRIVERLIEKTQQQRDYWFNRLEQRLHDELSAIHFARIMAARRQV